MQRKTKLKWLRALYVQLKMFMEANEIESDIDINDLF
jgi:hypothetical protein